MPRKKSTPPEKKPATCTVKGCGRPRFAKGLCQTHHRQFTRTGETRPIRPYRRRMPGTVQLSGHRVSAECAELIKSYAKRKQVSVGAMVAEILEGWNAGRK